MPAGRPSKYKPEYAKQLIAYFREKHENNKFPTLAGFACHIGVHAETLLNWANEENDSGGKLRPEFFEAYKMAKCYQEESLVQGGLESRFHGSFAIFTAKNVLGWRDQQDHNVNATLNVNLTGKDAQV